MAAADRGRLPDAAVPFYTNLYVDNSRVRRGVLLYTKFSTNLYLPISVAVRLGAGDRGGVECVTCDGRPADARSRLGARPPGPGRGRGSGQAQGVAGRTAEAPRVTNSALHACLAPIKYLCKCCVRPERGARSRVRRGLARVLQRERRLVTCGCAAGSSAPDARQPPSSAVVTCDPGPPCSM